MAPSRYRFGRRQQRVSHHHQLMGEKLEKRLALNSEPVLLSTTELSGGIGHLGEAFPASLDSRIIFSASQDAYNEELWVTDGSMPGTEMLANVFSRNGTSGIRNLTVFGDEIFFTCNTAEYGHELWVTNGTQEGTHLAKDLWAGGETDSWDNWMPNSSEPKYLTATEGGLFFVANQGDGERIYKYDPLADTVVPILDSHGTEIIPYSGSGQGDAAIAVSDSFRDAVINNPRVNGKILNDGRHLYFFTPNPPSFGGGGSSGTSPDDWMRYDSVTDQLLPIIDNSPNSSSRSVGARAIIDGDLYFQSGSEMYVVQQHDFSARKIFQLPSGNIQIGRLISHGGWVYAELTNSSQSQSQFQADTIIRFTPAGEGYENAWSVLSREGALPDSLVKRGIQILGGSEEGLLFVESVSEESGEHGGFGGGTYTYSRTDTVKVLGSGGAVEDVMSFGPFDNNGKGVVPSESCELVVRQPDGRLNRSVIFNVLSEEEVEIVGGGMGGGGSTYVSTVSVKKVFISDGSAGEVSELVSQQQHWGGLWGAVAN